MPKKSAAEKGPRSGGELKEVSDPRFSSMHTAPIFKKFKKDDNKLKLDNRFSKVLTDERFRSAPGAVDKYGRKAKKATSKAAKEELEQFYSIEDDDAEEIAEEDEDDEEVGVKNKKKKNQQKMKEPESRLEYLNKLARGEVSSSDSDEDGDSDNSSDSDSSSEDGDASVNGDVLSDEEDAPTGDATQRLAIQNLDWDNMTAEDIMVVMQSFCPSGRIVKNVVVYPSDFGKQQMEHEAKFGPAFMSRNDKNVGDDKNDDDGDEESGGDDELYDGVYGDNDESDGEDNAKDDKKKVKGGDFRRKSKVAGLVMQDELVRRGKADKSTLDLGDEEGKAPLSYASSESRDGVNVVALRKYELNKLKYFFAVAECDSVETADIVYKELDGLELENTSMTFDLRFVPDDLSFEERDIRDSTTSSSIAPNYKPPDFIVQALQHTNVECTWDDGDKERGRKLGQTFSKWKDLNESEFQQYLASESEDSEEDESPSQQKKQKARGKGKKDVRKLLLGDASGSDDSSDDGEEGGDDDFFVHPGSDDDDEDRVDDDGEEIHKEFSFMPKNTKESDDEAPEDETPFDKTMRKIAEKKKAKKLAKKALKTGQTAEQYTKSNGGGDLESEDDEPVRKEKSKSQSKKAEPKLSDNAASTEELDLMFGDGEEDYDMHSLVKAEKDKAKGKKKAKRGKKGKGGDDDDKNTEKAADPFVINTKDDRFSAMMNGDSRFGIDPLASEYKATQSMSVIMEEQKKRRKQGKKRDNSKESNEGDGAAAGDAGAQPEVDLDALKSRLKRRKA
jgi:hypothetical protein